MDNDILLKKKLSSLYKKIKFKIDYSGKKIYKKQEGNELISGLIKSNKPFMVSRFGATELNCIKCYLDNIDYNDTVKYRIKNHAGVFPDNNDTLSRFSKIYINSAKEADVIGVWGIKKKKRVIDEYCPKNVKLVEPRAIEPYYFNAPWSKDLYDKKVLVIHPFEQSIKKQYTNNRELLFEDKLVLPKFKDLIVIKAVQSIAGEITEFNDWIEAYNYMCDEISKVDFDIAIIGAGAYGLPLSAYIKSIGKQAIHMGGATQILFGIKGMRWDNHEYISKLYNEAWVRPTCAETPKQSVKVEGGSYW